MKLFVVAPAWVGDMVMAQALFKALKINHKNLQIDVLAPQWSKPLLLRMPEINQTIPLPLHHGELNLYARYRIAKRLRSVCYDQAIILQNSFKSALIPYWAGIPIRTGWLGEYRYGLINDRRIRNKKAIPQLVRQFVALAYPSKTDLPENIPHPSLKVDPLKRQESLKKFGLSNSPSQSLLILCPGAEFGETKRWPAPYYAEIARQKISEGWEIWLMGSQKDIEIGNKILQIVPSCINLIGKTSLLEAIDLLSLATAVISNDSGLLHIAAALERPIVAIYGSSHYQAAPPLNKHHQIVSLKLSCSPCFKRQCPLGHMRCLKDLTPDLVMNSLKALKV